MSAEVWVVAHCKHPTRYVDTKAEALALVDAWTTLTDAAACWPIVVEEEEAVKVAQSHRNAPESPNRALVGSNYTREVLGPQIEDSASPSREQP